MNSPAEILQIWIGNSVKKATLPTFKMILLGIALPNWSAPRSSLSD